VPAFFGPPFSIFLLRQFYLTITTELDDAAKIDGCGYFGIFRRILLPLAKPALATVAIFSFLANWNDFLGPLIYLSSQDNYTLALGISFLRGIQGTTAGNINYIMAASLMFVAPCIVLFFLAQRTFIQGIVTTGLKE
jgi:ABC-type glycerol-3-phosphate transport system permease component